MSYQVLARKWRPKTFGEVVGQEHVVRALGNALRMDRLHHAYLFAGTRGVGKTTVARILAKCLNCETGLSEEPCGQCSACMQVDAGRFVDLIEVDAASRTGVDDMRELLDSALYAPTVGRFKIYLIDEVHMLSASSFNALLKTLEEPPPHVKFFFATTHPQKLPVTILSRCLQFNLTRLSPPEIEAHLTALCKAESCEFEEAALRQIASSAEGSIRDALSLLDQALAYGGGALKQHEVETMLGIAARGSVATLLRAVHQGDAGRMLEEINTLYKSAADFESVLGEVITFLHEVALRQAAPDCDFDPRFPARDLAEAAAAMTPEDVQLFYQTAVKGKRDLPHLPDARDAFEMTLLRMLSFKPVSAVSQPDDPRPPKAAVKRGRKSAERSRAGSPATPVPDKPPPVSAEVSGQTPDAGSDREQAGEEAKRGDLTEFADGERWLELIDLLQLKGPVRELCYGSVLRVNRATDVTLLIDRKFEVLATENRKGDVRKAFADFAGDEVKVNFEVSEETVEGTPSQVYQHEERQRALKARQSIEQDTKIKALQDSFDATIVPGSVKPEEPR